MKIKSIILGLALAVASAFTSQANAQEVFKKGTNTASALIGVLGSSVSGTGHSAVIPPIQLSYEYGILDGLIDGKASVGVGGTINYFMSKISQTGVTAAGVTTSSTTSSNYGFLGARGSFHYQFIPKLDTYAGISLGLGGANSSTTTLITGGETVYYSGTNSSFGWHGHVGARYYFTPAFAVNAEFTYGFSNLNLGITYRF